VAELGRAPSPRQTELLEAAYAYTLAHGLADLSLRPLAGAIGSSPRVLLFLFGSKEGLIRALLARARADELAMLDSLRREHPDADLAEAARRVWNWLSAPAHRDLLNLWVEGYARSLVEPTGAWGRFAEQSVRDWLSVFADYQPPAHRRSAAGAAQRTTVLAVLRGSLLDLLATGDHKRTTAAVHQYLTGLL
jgi:AcrR family transcriptional regulator